VSLAEPLSIFFDLKNTGRRAGEEVVQLYVERPSSEHSSPRRALCGFQRVLVAAGATERVQLELHARDLRHWDTALGQWQLEAGDIRLLVGGSSAGIFTEITVTLAQ
jgi:beta-glucosidase